MPFEVRKNTTYSVHDSKNYKTIATDLTELEANRLASSLSQQRQHYEEHVIPDVKRGYEDKLEALSGSIIP